MNSKLKCNQLRISELEKELTQTRSTSTDTQRNAQHIQQVYDNLEKKYCELRYNIKTELIYQSYLTLTNNAESICL